MRPRPGLQLLVVTLLVFVSTMSVRAAFQVSSSHLSPLLRSHAINSGRCSLKQVQYLCSGQRKTPAKVTVVSCSEGPPEDPDRVSVTGVTYEGPAGVPTVTLFTKAECTLCDKVKEVLKEVQDSQPHTLRQTDITDPEHREWWDRYKYDIPVLHIEDKYWAKHRLTPEEATEALSQAAQGDFSERKGQPDAARLERE